MRYTLLSFIALVALGLSFTEAKAQNLIINGGFESNGGNGSHPDSWNDNNFVSTGISSILPHSGDFFLAFGSVGSDADTSQIVATVLGQTYDLQFFYARDGGTPSDFNVFWNGVPIFSEANLPAHDWEQHDLLVAGTGSDTLTFSARNDPSWDGLDDVSLTPVAVPEPTTWTLIGVCTFGSSGYVAWKKRQLKKSSFARLK